MKRKGNSGGPAVFGGNDTQSNESVPLPPPSLSTRAKKLGALSAGPSVLVTGAAPTAVPAAGKARISRAPASKTKPNPRKPGS